MKGVRGWAPFLALGLFVLALSIELWPDPGGLLVWPGAIYSDLLTAHLPLSIFIGRSAVRFGELPLWNPLILGGQPLLGDPLAGLTYPPHWLTFLLPTPGSYNALLILHLLWGGWGIYRLARAQDQPPLAALLAAVAFVGAPRWLGHWGLGHVTLVYAVSWTPWLLAATGRAVAGVGAPGSWRRFAVAGGLLGLILSVDPRWAPPSALLALGYAAFLFAHSHKGVRQWRAWAGGGLVAAATAVATSAWLMEPLWRFARHSTRWTLTAPESATLALPPAALIQILVPAPGAWPEWNVSLGVSVLLLAVVGALRGQARAWFWSAAALVGWVLSVGDATPAYPVARALIPGLSLTRVPARLSFLSLMATALLAGEGLTSLLSVERVGSFQRRARLGLVAVSASIGFLLIGLAAAWGPASLLTSPQFGWTAAVAAPATVALLASLGRLGPSRRLPALLVGLVAVELLAHGWSSVELRPLGSPTVPAVVERAADGFGGSRLFSPSYSLPQLAAAREDLELADGVNPLQLRTYWNFMADAVGFPNQGYSVTLPPYPQGDPTVPWAPGIQASKLGWLAVSYIVSDYPLPPGGGLELAAVERGEWIYANPERRPRAWIQPGRALAPGGDWRPVTGIEWRPNRIRLQARGPGVVVVSENWFPGWKVRIDKETAVLFPVGGLLRGVQIAGGEHQVELTYRPTSALAAGGLSLVSWLFLLGLGWRRR